MTTLRIFLLVGTLSLFADAKFWKPSEDYLTPSNFIADEEKADLRNLPYCDPVGSRMESLIDFTSRSKRCYCNHRFHGERCEKIFRCESGRSINVTCDNPPNRFSLAASTRCISGQKLLEVCDCFHGYSGHLCSETANFGYPSFEQIHTKEDFGRIPLRTRTPHEQQEYEMAKAYAEKEDKMNRIGNYKIALFLADVFIFVAVMMCAKSMWLKAQKRDHNTRLYNLMEYERELLDSRPEARVDGVLRRRQSTGPPTYEEIMKRAAEAKETGTPAPSYVDATSRALEGVLVTSVLDQPTVSTSSDQTTEEEPTTAEEAVEIEMAENSEEIVRTERRLMLHV